MFLITNIIKVDFWMERVISPNNWKVPDLIYINSVCSTLYAEWSTDLRWALTEGHPVWKGGTFGTSLLSLRIEKNLINQGDFTTLSPSTKLAEHWGFMTFLPFTSRIQIQVILKYILSSLFMQIQITIISIFKRLLYLCLYSFTDSSFCIINWFLVQISKTE